MFSSINSKSTILKSTASSIQVIIDNNSEKETSYYQVNRSTDSLDELAQPPSPAVLKGPKVIWFNPKIIISTAPKYYRTNRPLPTITEWTTSSSSSPKIILAQRTVSGGDIEYTLGTRHGDTVIEDVERRHLADVLGYVTEAELRAFDSKELQEWADAEEAATQAETIELQRRRGCQNRPGQSHRLGRPPGSKKLGRPKKYRVEQTSGVIHTSIDRAGTLSSRTERRFQRYGTTTTVEEAFVALPQVKKRVKRTQVDISTGTSTNASSRLQPLPAENATNNYSPDSTSWVTDTEGARSEPVAQDPKAKDYSAIEVLESDEGSICLQDTRASSLRDITGSAPAKRFGMLSLTSESSNLSQASQPVSPSETRAQLRAQSPSLPPVTKARPDVVHLGDDDEEDAAQLLRQFQAPTLSFRAKDKGKRNKANNELKISPAPPTLDPDDQILFPKESNASLQVNHIKTPIHPTAGVKPKTPSCTSLTPLYPSNSAPSIIPRRRPSPFPSLSPPGKKPKTPTSRTPNSLPPQRDSPQQASSPRHTSNRLLSTSTIACHSTQRLSTTPLYPLPLATHPAAATPSTTSTPATTAVQGETELDFFIDAILDHRIVQQGSKRLIEYLIKWEGFPVERAEWHGADALVDAEDVIEAYAIRRAGIGGQLRA